MARREHSLEEIESELLFDRDISDESAASRVQREAFERISKNCDGLATAFEQLAAAADKKTAEFREEIARLKLDAELDELEGDHDPY